MMNKEHALRVVVDASSHVGRRSVRLLLAASAGLLFFLAHLELASAHGILVDAIPKAGATVAGPDVLVHLRFNSRIDVKRSRLTLILPDGTPKTLDIQPQQSPNTIKAQATGLQPGAYRMRWQALASDGHITRGEFPFHVK